MNADHGSKIEQACSSSLSAGYDEPEILRCSNRQFGPIGADAGQQALMGSGTIRLQVVAAPLGKQSPQDGRDKHADNGTHLGH